MPKGIYQEKEIGETRQLLPGETLYNFVLRPILILHLVCEGEGREGF